MTKIRKQLELQIDFGTALRLAKVIEHQQDLKIRGVYFLIESVSKPRKPSPFDKSVVYIGKAIKETIFTRCQKHLWSVQNALLKSGNPRTRPGVDFKRYRESIAFDASCLWLVPGIVAGDQPFLISCAEEYLIYEYQRIHRRRPQANTSG